MKLILGAPLTPRNGAAMAAISLCLQPRISHQCLYQTSISYPTVPTYFSLPPLIKRCNHPSHAGELHCFSVKLGYMADVFIAASFIHIYSNFSQLESAQHLFDEMPVKDLASWNSLLSGLCQNGDAKSSVKLLECMKKEGVKIDAFAIATFLPICVQMYDLPLGLNLHLYAVKHGLWIDLFVCNALINMYSKFGRLQEADQVFCGMQVRDTVSWNSVMAAHESNEDDPLPGLRLFASMRCAGFCPDKVTVLVLAGLASGWLDGRGCDVVLGLTLGLGLGAEDVAVGNAIVDMYAKSGRVVYAQKVFDVMRVKDVVSWNTLVGGYAQNGLAVEAIRAFEEMRSTGVQPSVGTWVSITPAYAQAGALIHGMRIHGVTVKTGISEDVFVGTCLVDLYGKCGKLREAMAMFGEVARTSTIPWNSIISCHAIHGEGEECLSLFEEMVRSGVRPDHVTFVSLLSACSHSGMVRKGGHIFRMMREVYGVSPRVKHYGCMVDLLARGGELERALELVRTLPVRPDGCIWGALLGACRKHGELELGKFVAARVAEVDPENVGYYMVMSNMYAGVGEYGGAHEVRTAVRDMGMRKTPGWSSVEIGGRVEVFYTGDSSHPMWAEMREELRGQTEKMKSEGYVADGWWVLQEVEEEEKEEILVGHSERLAMAFAIVCTPPNTPIRVFKNLRVCGDCHNATKFVSRIRGRDIIVRDSNRFHHFRDGRCSCNDYW